MTMDQSTPLRGAIAAMTRDNVIGLDGSIPWHYSEDWRRFKQRTLGSTIVMGRLTWESIGRKALPGRRNVVISSKPVDGADHFYNLETALGELDHEDVWIIGGGQIYRETLDWVNLLDITYVPDRIDDPDAVKFPHIDPEVWQVIDTERFSDSSLETVVYQRRLQ